MIIKFNEIRNIKDTKIENTLNQINYTICRISKIEIIIILGPQAHSGRSYAKRLQALTIIA